jgi:hypothetical protein
VSDGISRLRLTARATMTEEEYGLVRRVLDAVSGTATTR